LNAFEHALRMFNSDSVHPKFDSRTSA
jgi:hypothetical protein